MSSRRELLKLGTLAGVSALIPGAAEAGRERILPTPADLGPQPTRRQLQAQVNGAFYVSRANYPDLRLTLVRVADPALSSSKPGRLDCFRAVFTGPAKSRLGQDTYLLVNRGLGQLELFLVPMGAAGGGLCYYEASFNRVGAEGLS